MTGHKNWFESLRELEIPGYVQIGDNTTHQIEHVGDIPRKNKVYVECYECSKPCKKSDFCWTDSGARNASEV